MKNDKLVAVINGYQILPSNKPGCIFLRSPLGANFSVQVEVLYKIVHLLETDPEFARKLNLR